MQRGFPFLEFTKTLPDMPSATHHINGKEGLEGSQPGGPCSQPCRIAILIAESDGRLWQWLGICLAFTRPLTVEGEKRTDSGACIITGLSAKASLPASFLPAVHHAHPTRSGFPECHLV